MHAVKLQENYTLNYFLGVSYKLMFTSQVPPPQKKIKKKKLFRFKIAYQDNLLLIMIYNAILRTI